MAILKWRPQALRGLAQIEAYYNAVAPDYASFLAGEIFDRVDGLVDFPRLGWMVPEVGVEVIRELIIRDYRVMYVIEPESDSIEILTVLHSSRDFGTYRSDE